MGKLINQDDRFFVAGHRGMAGSAICRALKRSGYENLLTASRDELDLLDLQAVQGWFADNKPTLHSLEIQEVQLIPTRCQQSLVATAFQGPTNRTTCHTAMASDKKAVALINQLLHQPWLRLA